jgi:hypothetical protein
MTTEWEYPDPQMAEIIASLVKLAKAQNWNIPSEAIEGVLLDYNLTDERIAEVKARLSSFIENMIGIAAELKELS